MRKAIKIGVASLLLITASSCSSSFQLRGSYLNANSKEQICIRKGESEQTASYPITNGNFTIQTSCKQPAPATLYLLDEHGKAQKEVDFFIEKGELSVDLNEETPMVKGGRLNKEKVRFEKEVALLYQKFEKEILSLVDQNIGKEEIEEAIQKEAIQVIDSNVAIIEKYKKRNQKNIFGAELEQYLFAAQLTKEQLLKELTPV